MNGDTHGVVNEGSIRIAMHPVTFQDVVSMASLTRDFHPLQVMPEAASQAGQRAPVLHSAWISGLVGSGLEKMACGRGVAQWSIRYGEVADVGEHLILEASVVTEARLEFGVKVVFTVFGPARKLVADGEGLIK